MFLEGNGCATYHGKFIHWHDTAARREPVNSAGIDGTSLAQITQEILPVALIIALGPQVEKGFIPGQETTWISFNGGARPRQALARRVRRDVQRLGQGRDQTLCPHGTRFGERFFDGGHWDVTLLKLLTLPPSLAEVFFFMAEFSLRNVNLQEA